MNKDNFWQERVKKLTKYYLYFMIVVFLFFTGSYGYLRVTESKFLMFSIVSSIYLLLGLTIIVIGKLKQKSGFISLEHFFKNLEISQKCAALYLVFTWISAICSVYWPYTVIGTSRYEGAFIISLYVLVFFFVSYYAEITERQILVFSGAVFVFDILCIIQLFDYNPFYLYPSGLSFSGADVDYSGAYIGTIGNTDLVAAFFSIVIPIFLLLALKRKDKKRFIFLAIGLLSLGVLLKIRVAAGVLAIIVGLTFSFVAIIRNREKRKIAIIIWCIIVLFFLVMIYVFSPNSGTLYELHEILHGNWDNSYGSSRVFIWKSVLSHINEHFFLGHGPDTMIFANFDQMVYFDEATGQYLSYIDVAHNEYLNVFYHQGFFAFIAYLMLVISVIVMWIKNPNNLNQLSILGSSVLCYCIQAFFGFSMAATAPYFWICLGLFVYFSRNVSVERNEEENC